MPKKFFVQLSGRFYSFEEYFFKDRHVHTKLGKRKSEEIYWKSHLFFFVLLFVENNRWYNQGNIKELLTLAFKSPFLYVDVQLQSTI